MKSILITQAMYDAAVATDACEEELEKVGKMIGKRSKNAFWAYWYAFDVLKSPWPECEDVIKTDPEWAYYYARNVLKSPWPEGEDVIKTNPRRAFRYARDVLKLDHEAAEKWSKTK